MKILINVFAIVLVIVPFVVGAAAIFLVPALRDEVQHLEVVVSAELQQAPPPQAPPPQAQQQQRPRDDPRRAQVEQVEDEWVIRGRVLLGGTLVEGATVWANAEYGSNRRSPKTEATSNTGEFTFEKLPGQLVTMGGGGGAQISEVTVFANWKDPSGKILKGKEIISIIEKDLTRQVQLSPGPLMVIPIIFIVSVLLALVDQQDNSFLRGIKYYGGIVLTAGFTIALIAYMAWGLQYVDDTLSPGEDLSLGFAHFHFGTYASNVPEEWIFSLTAPAADPESMSDVSKGFGAPLWVVFLAVLGAGIFTFSVLIYEIRSPVSFTAGQEVRDRSDAFVRHQFYILFSPLGAIVVYQLLVIAGAVNEQVTVGVTALAAGLGLNLILDKSWKTVEGLVSGSSGPSNQGGSGSGGQGPGRTV
jgi:hypothetical protein